MLKESRGEERGDKRSEADKPQSALKLFVIITLSVFLSEVVIMIGLSYLDTFSWLVEALLDATLLTALVSPCIYFFVFKPQTASMKKVMEAESALRESEQKMQAIIRSIGDGIISVDSSSIIRFVNKELCKMFGYEEGELVGQEVLVLMPHKYRELHSQGMKSYKATHQRKILGEFLELEGLKKNGDIFPIEFKVEEATTEGLEDKMFTASIRDMTSHKDFEKALQASEERFRSSFESSSVSMNLTSLEGKFIQVNRSFCDLLGYSEKELLGMGPRDITHPDYIDMTRSKIMSLIAGEVDSVETEKKYIRKDGTIIWAVTNVAMVKDQDGEPLYMVAQINDITRRIEAEDKLRQAHSEQNTILENAIVGIAFFQNKKVVWANQRFSDILGLSSHEIQGESLKLFYPGGLREFAHAEEESSVQLSHGVPYTGELRLRRKNGEFFWCRLSINAIDHNDPSKGTIRVMEDITERKQAAEQLLREKERAENATELKDKFVSLVSHDLKGPLANMLSFLKLVKDEDKGKLLKAQKEHLKTADSICNKLLVMIEELLNISRLKTGKLVPEPVFQDASYFGVRAVVDYSIEAERKGVSLENKIPPNTRIFVDPALFSEVISNLVSNAIKFSNKGDVIRMLGSQNDESEIIIEDTGNGIDKDNLGKLFVYEHKTTTTGTAGETGTGLGLPLCKDIMEAHGGAISVSSTVGEGSRFKLSLPKKTPAVLVVDDEKVCRMMIKNILGNIDVKILEATNGKEALAVLESEEVNLVVTDITMPEMDGFALLSEIRSNPATRKMPVVVITGDNDMEVREKAFRLGANDFSDKTAQFHDFIPRVRRFIF